MIQLSVPEVALFKSVRENANTQAIGYWEIYKTLADLLQGKYGASSTDSTVLWLRGATEANACVIAVRYKLPQYKIQRNLALF